MFLMESKVPDLLVAKVRSLLQSLILRQMTKRSDKIEITFIKDSKKLFIYT